MFSDFDYSLKYCILSNTNFRENDRHILSYHRIIKSLIICLLRFALLSSCIMKGTIEIIENGGVTSATGFTAGAIYVGVKSRKKEKPDVALLISDRPASCAALFTTNRFCAAPVILGRKIAALGATRGVVLNSGNANAGTGKAGLDAALSVQRFAEDALGLAEDSLFVSSTGVIGEQLPVDKIKDAIRQIIPAMSEDGGHEAARAIMTTDRYSKEFACELGLSGGTVRIGAMAKGSGMVHPDMATILCFITTDAWIEADVMHAMLKKACDRSFNAVSVDGDSSTNDSLLMFANGASGVSVESEEDLMLVESALNDILSDMARRIARDGEGACKMMTVRVSGAPSDEEARKIARSVVSSNSVKAALGHGPIPEALVLSAAGTADSTVDFTDVRCSIESDEDMTLVDIKFSGGSGEAESYGCDLTEEYIRLNGFYRT